MTQHRVIPMTQHRVIHMTQHRVTYDALPPDVDDVITHLCHFLFCPQTDPFVVMVFV